MIGNVLRVELIVKSFQLVQEILRKNKTDFSFRFIKDPSRFQHLTKPSTIL